MKKFEYKVLSVKASGKFVASSEKAAEKLQEELNAVGVEGWELVDSSGNTAISGYFLLFLKRELNQ